jgi:magnesium transporter
MGMESIMEHLYQIAHREPPESVIPWQDMAAVEGNAPIRLRVSRDKISQLHPADIATIVSGLDLSSGEALLTALDTPTVADTMQEIEPELQVTIMEHLPPERAADVLEEMDPNDAADLLADLQPDDRAQLLDLMEDDEAHTVKKLLTYPEDSAGGIMSTEYTTIPRGLTVGQALEHVRKSSAASDDETMYYVYIVDEQNKLTGVATLRDLVLAPPDSPVASLREDHPVTVDLLTPQTEVARVVAKYNLLAVPVVDPEGIFHGIVTVDDAIDAIIPTAWKKRLPHFY